MIKAFVKSGETRRESLFYLFVRVYADLCTVKTMSFWCNEGAIVQKHCLAEALVSKF